MFKKMKLSTRLAAGFAVMVIIVVMVGSLAIVNMLQVSASSSRLVEENIPATNMANRVYQLALATMLDARGYAYTEEERFLENTRQYLSDMKQCLEEAQAHAVKYKMDEMLENTKIASAAAEEYERLLELTVIQNQELADSLASAEEEASGFNKALEEFLGMQYSEMLVFVDAYLGPLSVGEMTAERVKYIGDEVWIRTSRIQTGNAILDALNKMMIATTKAIGDRDIIGLRDNLSRLDELGDLFDKLRRESNDELNLRLIENCRTASEQYRLAMENFVAVFQEKKAIEEKRNAVAVKIAEVAGRIAMAGMKETEESAAGAATVLDRASYMVITGLFIAIILAVVIAVILIRSITKPVNRIILALGGGAREVSSAAEQVSASSQSLAEGAAEQAAAIEETSASFEEMSSMTSQNAENAMHADSLMSEAKQVVERANQSMNKLTISMDEISRASDETSRIVKTIDEIAFQTNLLALNAAVEAARAGEAGAGFAVVADEVRNLAIRAAEAAKNTAELIEGTVKKVREGSNLVTTTNEDFSQVGVSAAKVAELVGEIAAASAEQAQGIAQVNRGVAEMDKVTQQTAANAEETAAAAEELNAQAEHMQDMVHELMVLVQGFAKQKSGLSAGGRGYETMEEGDKTVQRKGAETIPYNKSSDAARTREKALKAIPLDDGEEEFRDF